MNDDYRSQSSSRGWENEPGAFRDRNDYGDEQDDCFRLRQGRRYLPRSPSRQGFNANEVFRNMPSRSRGPKNRSRDYEDGRRGRDEGYSLRRYCNFRRSHHHAHDERDFRDIYDDGHRVDDHCDESYRDGGHRGQGHRGDGYHDDGNRGDGHQGESYRAGGYRSEGYHGDGYQSEGYRGGGYRGEGYRGDGYHGNDFHFKDNRRHEYHGRHPRVREWDAERYQRNDDRRRRNDSDYDHHPRAGSRSRIRGPGRPTDTVMLEGLPSGISVPILRRGLLDTFSPAVEPSSIDVRVTSSRGNCGAFVQFSDIDGAISFIKEHFPKLTIYLPQSTDDVPYGTLVVDIHYAYNRGDVDASRVPPTATEDSWYCDKCDTHNYGWRDKCMKCASSPSAFTPAPQGRPLGRTGAADVARDFDQKLPILVVFPLLDDMDEDALAAEMKRLELVKKEKPKGEPYKLKSTAPSVDGAGYGAQLGSVHRVFLMRYISTNQKLPYGFVEFWSMNDALAALKKYSMTRSFEISNQQVTLALIHTGVFVPLDEEVGAEEEHLSFVPAHNPTIRVRYRDYDLYPSPKIVSNQPPSQVDAIKADKDKADVPRPKKRKADDGQPESTAKKAPAMAAQMAFWQRKYEEIRGGRNAESTPPNSATNNLVRKPSMPIKFSMPGAGKTSTTIEPASTNSETEEQAAAEEADVSYVDRVRLACLICMKQYKSIEEVDIHEKSTNHQRAMADKAKVKAALPRLAARDRRLQQAEVIKYRDRAKERREAHNQPENPVPRPHKPKQDGTKQQVKGSVKKQAESKGAGILAKMGWSTGKGLGLQSTGVSKALTVNAYKSGVGLGAQGGKLGDAAEMAEGRTTDNYSSYLEAAQQKARERYSQLE